MFRDLDGTVFPSEERTICVAKDSIYGGAHRYYITDCTGFHDGKTEYVPGQGQTLQFVMKDQDGVIPGAQSEQLVLVLLDRHARLNERFPSPHYAKMKEGLEMFLEACKARVEERMERGVMGQLTK